MVKSLGIFYNAIVKSEALIVYYSTLAYSWAYEYLIAKRTNNQTVTIPSPIQHCIK